MGYELRAVIADARLLQEVNLFDAVTDREAEKHADFWGMPCGFDRLLARWSRHRPIAYVEAEYFGGVGEQSAAVWERERISLGPLKVGERESSPVEGSPVSQALRSIGVRRRWAHDEFDAVGLGQHRHIEDWIS
ncbi:hypothetical protein [Nonomuraea roseola]|uniref:Uncharacterized protein n=1 Tax=Nonomuraea roseola TaxID=46179 RepID=A0ABV5Q197_9ACTN